MPRAIFSGYPASWKHLFHVSLPTLRHRPRCEPREGEPLTVYEYRLRQPVGRMCEGPRPFARAVGGRGECAWRRLTRDFGPVERQGGGGRAFFCPYGGSPADPGGEVGTNFARFWCRHRFQNLGRCHFWPLLAPTYFCQGRWSLVLPLATDISGCQGQNGAFLPLGGGFRAQNELLVFWD